ncbi:MAG: hypoxanthine phosphoribosyltransferase [Candidatus Eisenbacteria bacterium]|uniref:Hypoxanthine phosphoribosyltransferase n=1 Tax=Eiseniibacteriota bacterium TaxID=2212470 RepID=A0A948W6E2_UNCEI|nr:hypoxanthine phosphoribosyltransferase [Candidatus Eisenbacteria bacterium]MBU1947761.1 hypoxanthine phosphoribosyltransferase [Candidatus Eisenbacteria bacterium]MBU2691030.1 hypoxanthine phosphoribosyltransferase [Candidatus Eisenbacteria bacterium]
MRPMIERYPPEISPKAGESVTMAAGPAVVLFDTQTLGNRLGELAEQISADFQQKDPILVCLLRGGFVFLTDLSRSLSIPHEVDFLQVSRYDPREKDPTGVKLITDLRSNVRDRHVLVIEGIRTRGTKINYVDRFLELHAPASRTYAALLVQGKEADEPIPLHYCGFRLDNEFVVGMGLDYGERYRNLPYVAAIGWEPRI